MSQDRAGKIKLLLFDVDGVLTDGKIWVLPATRGVRQSTQKSGGSNLKRGGGGFASSDYLEAKGKLLPKNSPTDCLCLGRARVGNRWVFFSLLTLLFSGVFDSI